MSLDETKQTFQEEEKRNDMGKLTAFDTRDKKPALWNVAGLTAVVAAVCIFLIYNGGQKNAIAANFVLCLYFLTVIILLMDAFFKQLQYNPYSYNTIYYSGFSLFFLSVLITHTILAVQMVRYPELYLGLEGQEMDQIAGMLLGSAKTYMLLSAPFILAFSSALCVSNISLIRHEGKRFVNLLGIILSFLMVGGEVFLYRFDYYVSGSLEEVRRHELFGNLFASVYLYFECMLIGAIIAKSIVARYTPEPDKDFLIILGCGIRKDGTPSPLLRGRIDRALDFRNRQVQTTGKDLIFVTSGGQGPDEVQSESASMKQYLLEKGVPEERIIEEDRSTSTFENMKFSKEKIWEKNPDGKIAFSTTNYHVFRGGLYARRVKMRALGMGAKTKWYFWPNAAVREFVGLLTEHRGKQALIFGTMIVIYVALTLYVYRY